jgi:hypothetical protein
VTYDCLSADREHRGHAPAFEAQAGMTDCVNTPMDAMKPTSLLPPGCRSAIKPRPAELRGAHDAELPGRDPGDNQVGFGGFVPHIGTNPPTARPLPSTAGPLPFIARFLNPPGGSQ